MTTARATAVAVAIDARKEGERKKERGEDPRLLQKQKRKAGDLGQRRRQRRRQRHAGQAERQAQQAVVKDARPASGWRARCRTRNAAAIESENSE